MDITLIKRIQLVDRNRYITRLCRGKLVLHLGCTDAPYYKQQITDGRLLQKSLIDADARVIGIDIDEEALSWMANRLPGEYHCGNIEDTDFMLGFAKRGFEVVLLTDVLEHLNNPYLALDNINKITSDKTDIIITVPNAFAVKIFLRIMVGHELVHPDHVSWQTLATLSELLDRAGFEVVEPFSFLGGGKGLAAGITNVILRFIPRLAEGIGVRCRVRERL